MPNRDDFDIMKELRLVPLWWYQGRRDWTSLSKVMTRNSWGPDFEKSITEPKPIVPKPEQSFEVILTLQVIESQREKEWNMHE